MTKMLFALSLGFAGLILALQAGFAAPACASRTAVAGQLAEPGQDTPRGAGIAALFAVIASGTGSRTTPVTAPGGLTCLVAPGRGRPALSGRFPAKGHPV